MGRKPSAIVVEFYTRGAKLPDASNRYHHICKRCGEEFPKGRLDNLTSHLLRRCSNVTQQDREWVFQQIQQNPERSTSTSKEAELDALSSTQQAMFSTSGLQQQSALDTLAEVSRHYSTRHPSTGPENGNSGNALSDLIAEQALLAELRGHADLKSPTYPLRSTSLGNDEAQTPPPLASRSPLQHNVIPATSAASPLVQTASAANQQLALEQARDSVQTSAKSLVDPQLRELPRQIRAHAQKFPDSDPSTANWRPVISSIAPRPEEKSLKPSEESTAVFETTHMPVQAKKRARFDDNRRKQVSDIRKRGACIRCRMLKKPCSGDTPCNTCKTVESARLWKGTCVRTRLADEFTLYSTNLFQARAKIDVSAALQSLSHVSLPGLIEVRFHSGSTSCVSFTARALDDGLGKEENDRSQYFAQSRIESTSTWVLGESEAIEEKLENYLEQTVDDFVENEPSTFVRATLKQAQKLIGSEEIIKTTIGPGDQEKRSSYNLQHQLLKTLVELWILTKLLTRNDEISLQLRYNAQIPPDESERAERAIEQTAWTVPNTSRSYQLIQAQLLAAVEARASKLSKAAINELERRLLQRQRVSRFSTYLAAVILLSCAERMCSLYYGFDVGEVHLHHDKQSKQQNATGSRDDESSGGSNHPESWPIDTPPVYLWSQGQSFSHLLSMLLRMRALPSLTSRKLNGTLTADKNSSGPVSVTDMANEQIDEHTAEIAWLESLRSSINEAAWTADGIPQSRGGPEAWNMRLVSKLLWPATE